MIHRGRTGLVLLAALAAGGGCRGESQAEGADQAAPAGVDDGVAGSARSAWITVEAPADASLIELPAEVHAASSSRARLDTPFRATVVSASVQVGDTVAKGDAIVELRIPAVIEAAAILEGASAQIDAHEQRRDRLETLRQQGLVGSGDVFAIESGLGKLSADRRLALATLQAAGIDRQGRRDLLRRGTVVLRAPTAGVVAEVDAAAGDVVEPGESLAQILGRGRARIQIAHSGTLPDDVRLEFLGLDGSRFELRTPAVATATEPGLGRTLAWYEPADDRELADGVRGHVRVSSAGHGELLEVPRRALRLHEGQAFVARRSSSDQAEAVPVQVVRSAGSSALIRSEGLAVGDQVAADAATVLQLGHDPDAAGGHHH